MRIWGSSHSTRSVGTDIEKEKVFEHYVNQKTKTKQTNKQTKTNFTTKFLIVSRFVYKDISNALTVIMMNFMASRKRTHRCFEIVNLLLGFVFLGHILGIR